MCHCKLTVEGEVAKHRNNEVNQEAEADTDICNDLHLALSRSGRQKDTLAKRHVYIA